VYHIFSCCVFQPQVCKVAGQDDVLQFQLLHYSQVHVLFQHEVQYQGALQRWLLVPAAVLWWATGPARGCSGAWLPAGMHACCRATVGCMSQELATVQLC
jgi:hypothetical protein